MPSARGAPGAPFPCRLLLLWGIASPLETTRLAMTPFPFLSEYAVIARSGDRSSVVGWHSARWTKHRRYRIPPPAATRQCPPLEGLLALRCGGRLLLLWGIASPLETTRLAMTPFH